MLALLVLLGAVLPLAMAPKLLFHYDVTPKTVVLLAAACVGLMRTHALPEEMAALWRRAGGRALVLLAAAQTVWMSVATLTSDRPWFSLFGSGWRQFGLVATLASLVVIVLAAGHFCLYPERIRLLLRAVAMATLVTSLYGIAQYFDVDPLQPAAIYHAHAGDSVIVRPPGTFGHADYFGWWLAIALFCAIALTRTSEAVWRAIAICCVALAAVAAILTGTRAALAAITAGLVLLAILARTAIRWKHILLVGAFTALLAGFYFSAAGIRLRARAAWSGEEPAGGARPLLWRDSLQMAAAHPWTGYGPETYQSAFGVWQSEQLARLYPDFHHESPHNVALDALTSQGFPGLLLTLAWVALGFRAVVVAMRAGTQLAVPLAAALLASATASLFSALSLAPVLLTLLVLAILTTLEPGGAPSNFAAKGWVLAGPCYACAACFACIAVAGAIADFGLAKFQRTPSIANYESAVRLRLPGPGEDIYCSRILLNACEGVNGMTARLECWRTAEQVAARGTNTADDTANAWYNLAYFTAAQNDARGTAIALNRAIQLSPNWFKPHWALARLLSQTGDFAKAASEAERAAFLNGNHDPEVLQTLQQLRARGH